LMSGLIAHVALAVESGGVASPGNIANPYDSLLREFQEGYAKYGQDCFFLGAMKRSEFDSCRNKQGKEIELVGIVCTDQQADESGVYYICAPIRKMRFGKWCERYDDPLRDFVRIATQAGASLPLTQRQKVSIEPAGPVAWWLAFMWTILPPSEEDLMLDESKGMNCRVAWSEPFLDSATVIELGGLLEPRALPRGTQEGEGRTRTAGSRYSPFEIADSQFRVRVQAKWFDVTESQCQLLRSLRDSDGDWVSGKKLKNSPGSRPDRLIAKLPNEIKKLIESHQLNGYRIRPDILGAHTARS
jgi:hypothetical protein